MMWARSNDLQDVAKSALESMRRHDVAATPDNYTLWFEYHFGRNSSLCRTIDAIISNGRPFDEKTLDDLQSFFHLTRESHAVHETSVKVLSMLREIVSVVSCAQEETGNLASTADFEQTIENLRRVIDELVTAGRKTVGRSEHVVIRMRESADKIKLLEQNLELARRDAASDALTGLANRRSFDASLRIMAGDAMNSGEELSLLLIDIDHFKQVNDTWGHQIGDLVLRYTALGLKQCVREDDIVARYGGEEFAILLPRIDCSSAAATADEIRQFLLREPCRIEGMRAIAPITVSIGVSNYYPGEALTEWIARADQALYTAKQEGRNCVRSVACLSSQVA